MYTPGTIENRVSTKIKINGAVAKVYIYKDFSGTTDTLRHLKIFRVIFNEIPVLLPS